MVIECRCCQEVKGHRPLPGKLYARQLSRCSSCGDKVDDTRSGSLSLFFFFFSGEQCPQRPDSTAKFVRTRRMQILFIRRLLLVLSSILDHPQVVDGIELLAIWENGSHSKVLI